MSRPAGFFRGQELSRLLVLIVILAAGLTFTWQYLYFKDVPAAEPVVVADAPPEPVVADSAIEFESVTDKTPIALRDMAAYAKLLTQARETNAVALATRTRKDLLFAHLWGDPKLYRGVPVHLLGTAYRVMRYQSKLSKNGWLYEAWIVTPDSKPNPYVCVFEDVPRGLPIGDNVNERVVFNGYFLKQMAYIAHDVTRVAPLLIGRIGWTPSPSAVAAAAAAKGVGIGRFTHGPVFWMSVALALMFVVSLFRWLSQLRRSLAPKTSPRFLHERPTEEIAPDDLASYLESLPDEDAGQGHDEQPSR